MDPKTTTIDQQKNKGGHIIRYEPTKVQEIMVSQFFKKSFQDVGCLVFCQKIQELGFNEKLTSTFDNIVMRDKEAIVGV